MTRPWATTAPTNPAPGTGRRHRAYFLIHANAVLTILVVVIYLSISRKDQITDS